MPSGDVNKNKELCEALDRGESSEWIRKASLNADLTCDADPRYIPLHVAIAKGRLDVCEMFLAKGAPLSSRNEGGWTCLTHAAYFNKADIFFKLARLGADLYALTAKDSTCLHAACFAGHEALVILLLGMGFGVTAQNGDGATCLHGACAHNNPRICQLLLDKGADALAKDNLGRTSIDVARTKNNMKVVAFLEGWVNSNGSGKRKRGDDSIEDDLKKERNARLAAEREAAAAKAIVALEIRERERERNVAKERLSEAEDRNLKLEKRILSAEKSLGEYKVRAAVAEAKLSSSQDGGRSGVTRSDLANAIVCKREP